MNTYLSITEGARLAYEAKPEPPSYTLDMSDEEEEIIPEAL